MSRHAAVILAAGLGARFAAAGGSQPTKLLALHRGQPLVRHVAVAALASEATPVIVVTGHARAVVEASLAGLPVEIAHNARFADGLASSLRCGLDTVPADAAAIVVMLADMPGVTAAVIDDLIARARACPGADAVVPVHDGRRGNPVLLRSTLFGRLAALTGDSGARSLLRHEDLRVETIEQPGTILDDIDHPADLLRLAARSCGTLR